MIRQHTLHKFEIMPLGSETCDLGEVVDFFQFQILVRSQIKLLH